jgi:hypothetical protein
LKLESLSFLLWDFKEVIVPLAQHPTQQLAGHPTASCTCHAELVSASHINSFKKLYQQFFQKSILRIVSFFSQLFLLFLLKEKVSKKFKAGAKAPPAQPCPRTTVSHYCLYIAL